MSLKYTLSKNQIFTTLSGENIILNFNKGNYYSLNEVGTFIWDQIKEQALTLEQIKASVISAFDVDASTCETDILKVLDELIKEDLIEIKE